MQSRNSAFDCILRVDANVQCQKVAKHFITKGIINGYICIYCCSGESRITQNFQSPGRHRYRCFSCGRRYSTTSLTFLDSMNLNLTQFAVMLKYFLMNFSSLQSHQLIQNHFNQYENISLTTVKRHFHNLRELIRFCVGRDALYSSSRTSGS